MMTEDTQTIIKKFYLQESCLAKIKSFKRLEVLESASI